MFATIIDKQLGLIILVTCFFSCLYLLAFFADKKETEEHTASGKGDSALYDPPRCTLAGLKISGNSLTLP